MEPRRSLSSVSIKVYHHALILREFTAQDIVRLTGLDSSSVRTVLDRMNRKGLVTSQKAEAAPQGRRGPRKVYLLTKDPDIQLKLQQEVEAFSPSMPPSGHPTSRYYHLAQRFIDRAQIAPEDKREQLLADAARFLEISESAEGGSQAPETIRAYLEYEKARLAFWRGELQEAQDRFQGLVPLFQKFNDASMMDSISEYLHLIEGGINPRGSSLAEVSRLLLEKCTTCACLSRSPAAVLLMNSLRQSPVSPRSSAVQPPIIEDPTIWRREITAKLDFLIFKFFESPEEEQHPWPSDKETTTFGENEVPLNLRSAPKSQERYH